MKKYIVKNNMKICTFGARIGFSPLKICYVQCLNTGKFISHKQAKEMIMKHNAIIGLSIVAFSLIGGLFGMLA